MLERALQRWQEWNIPAAPTLIRVFDSGENHHTGLIESGSKRFVLKVFNHSFERTIKAERWASHHGFSPRLAFSARNIAIYEFIDDKGFSLSRIPSLGRALNAVHSQAKLDGRDSTNVVHQHFDLLSVCDTYLTTLSEATHVWHRALMPALLEFINDPTPPTFCHNDLVIHNCLFDPHSVKFIDWEYAQLNNPWFDLAAVIHYFKLSPHDAAKLLSSYQIGWERRQIDPIFYSSQIAVLWCDLLWNMHNHGNRYRLTQVDRFKQLISLAAKKNITLPFQAK